MSTRPLSEPKDMGTSGLQSGMAQGVRVLSEPDLDAIHGATLRTLEKVGVRIAYPPALDLLRSAGAKVEGEIVHFPRSLVEDVIAHTPSRVTLHARNPDQNVYLGEGRVHFTNGFGATWVEDHETGDVRKATLDDLSVFTRLADALEHVDYCLFSVVPQDVPPRLLDLQCTATALENTSKHIQLSLETAEWIADIVELARASVGPGRPLPISAGGVPHSPLAYTADAAAKFMLLAQHEIPCLIVSGAMAGATVPVTLAGALVVQNAELLAGIAIHQLTRPGAPVFLGTFAGGFDMRATKLATGGPEITLISCATQQLANRYGIPLGYATGGMSDSLRSDVQAGIEKASSVLFAALCGVDVIHDGASGLLGAGMLTSLSQMVIDNELCHSLAYALQGIRVDEASLAEEVIASVGPGGQYLAIDHTAQHFRKSLYLAPLRSRSPSAGSPEVERDSMLRRAAMKAGEILQQHQPCALPDGARETFAAVLERARQKTNTPD